MKRLFFLLTFLYSFKALGQDNCPIDFIPKSNKILYNQKVIEEIIEPSNYSAFFLGESHTINFEPEFKFNFIKHLNSKYGVKDVFLEIGFSAAYFFNKYLLSGDTTIFINNSLPYLWGHYKDFWNDLYNYNKLLPDSVKIVIYGLDFERKEIFKLFEKAIQPNVAIPIHLQKTFEDIQTLNRNRNLFFGDTEFKKRYQKLSSTFQTYQNDFKTLYGDNYKIIYNAITNKASPNLSLNQRNKIWLENIKQIITEKSITKFIGFFGLAHTRYNNSTSLTVALKQCDFFNGEILNISTIYKDFISTDNPNPNEVVEYGYKEKSVFDKFYNKNCRAVIIKSSNVPKTSFKTESDFVIFAKEVSDK
ncbi:MAG: hypothetical protein IPF72_17305 [Chitinophagaceae bacterium]|nr:hypothetical protein [Chitinophagaceae bacterium]